MKQKHEKKPGHFVLPADSKISSAQILNRIFDEVLKCTESQVIIDASRVYWLSPFTACWFAALYDKLKSTKRDFRIIPPDRDNAKHQFDGLGIKNYILSLAPQTSPKWFTTFPVTRLTEPSYPLAGKVTRLLTEKLSGVENFHKALHFAIREIIENAFEHGQTDHCYMCAYSVPSSKVVRLCILDTGIGIPESMRLSKKYSHLIDDLEAVEKASEYGVSSKAEERGIGLYILRDVANKNEAEFTILSGQAKVDISENVAKTKMDLPFPGTAIKLRLRTRRDFYYLSVAEWEAL